MNRQYLSVDPEDMGTLERRTLDNGQIEEIHTMPKLQYYTSLRVGSNLSVSRNASRVSINSTLNKRSSFIQGPKSNPSVYKESGKLVECAVTMLDGEEKMFKIDTNSLGSHLFDLAIESLFLKEPEYFGLKYTDNSVKIWFWLQMDKKISDQLKKNKWSFEFQVKFYTPHINNIQEDLTRYTFCLQVRQNIVAGIIPASFNVLVILGAYAVQSEAGDYDGYVRSGIDYIREMPFAPKTLQTDELLTYIANLHKQISHQSPEEADRNFLWNATKLGMYGVDMHKVKNTYNEEVSVGVYHSGILIYKGRIRVIRYSWPKILRLSYKNKSFFLVLRATDIDKRERNIEFKCATHSLAKRLWLACGQHHAFFRMLDAENPGKPRLNPGFGTRKYRLGSHPDSILEPDTSSLRPNSIISQPQAKIRRLPTQLRDNQVLLSPSGIAPVVSNDEVFSMEEDVVVTRPDLPTEYWKMFQEDSMPQIGMDTSGLDVCASEGTGWQGTRANKGVKGPGKYYYECKFVEDGLLRLGWSTNDGSLDLGSDKYGFCYGSDQAGTPSDKGFKRNNKEEKPYGQPVHEGDVIGCCIDFDNGRMQWSKNGIPFEIAYQIPDEMKSEAFFPATSIKDGRIMLNFGDLPTEFMPIGDWSTLADAPATNVVPNKFAGWRMNPFDAIKGTEVSENGLIIQSKYNHEWHGCRSNKGVFDAGKYYYEVVPLENGLARVGWSTDEGSLNLGTDRNGFGYGADHEGFGLNNKQSKKMNSGEIENYGDVFEKKDVIGCFLDLDNHTMKWSKNGTIFKEAYLIPDDLVELRAFYPTASLVNNTLDFNFGNKPFEFYPGSEWNAVCFAANGNTEYSKKENRWLLRRPSIGHHEDVLELRRLQKAKMNSETDNEKKLQDMAEEKRQKIMRETERIERQERERRILLQKEREEKEREFADAERIKREQLDLEEDQLVRRENEEQSDMRRRLNQTTDVEEESETIIKGLPETTTETYVDEQGRTVTRILRKTKITKCTSVNRNTIERTEDQFSQNKIHRLQALPSIEDEDDELIRAIFEVTRLSPSITVMQNVRHMSMTSI